MSKQSNNIALFCASVILGFTQVSFAADVQPEPPVMNIPPPPSLRAANGEDMSGNVGTNPNSVRSLVGNSRETAPSTQVSNEQPKKGLFANNTSNSANSAAATQHANAVAANAEEAARKAAQVSLVPPSIRWGSQLFPAANTFYLPSSK